MNFISINDILLLCNHYNISYDKSVNDITRQIFSKKANMDSSDIYTKNLEVINRWITEKNCISNIRNYEELEQYVANPDTKYSVYDSINQDIQRMPPLDEELIVFRGSKRNISESQINDKGILQKWISASIKQEVALDFINNNNECCLYIIHLKPGVKIIPVFKLKENENNDTFDSYRWEQEIIIEAGGVFEFIGETNTPSTINVKIKDETTGKYILTTKDISVKTYILTYTMPNRPNYTMPNRPSNPPKDKPSDKRRLWR